jgi:GNAT superfamily N-acetyltransferase
LFKHLVKLGVLVVKKMKLKFYPLTPERWKDLERLFGDRGACGGCWCMWWRLKRSQFDKQKGEGNRRAFRKIVRSGEVPGILAYADGESVGWCSVAPREAFPVLDRSRILKRVDEKPVWSIVCFFVTKTMRNKGVSRQLIKAAVGYAKRQGGKIAEGYPVELKKGKMPDAFVWTGLTPAFQKNRFTEVLRRSETRPIMRKML